MYVADATGTDGSMERDILAARVRVEGLRSRGQSLRAVDEAEQGLARWPGDLRLQQLKALALADCGATLRANAIMSRLVEAGNRDAESMGILARTCKDLWERSRDPEERAAHLARARDISLGCFEETGDIYPGINGATLALLSGEAGLSGRVARQVRAQVEKQLETSGGQSRDYYQAATLAEVELLLGNHARAMELYGQAGRIGRQDRLYRALYSTRCNARHILEAPGRDRAEARDLARELATALKVPAVSVFTGHMTDAPDRSVPRYPDKEVLHRALARELTRRLQAMDAGIVYASAARGGDIILLELARELGLEAHVVLPYNLQQFVADSVASGPGGEGSPEGSDWTGRFRDIIDEARAREHLSYASDWPIGHGGDSFEYANRILLGLASLHAQRLGTEVKPLAVWDGREGDGIGGTGTTVAWWRSKGLDVEVVDLGALLEGCGEQIATAPLVAEKGEDRRQGTVAGTPMARIRAMLFADVVDYSFLREEHIPPFIEHFIGGIADMLGQDGPEVRNTWGDAFYFVFADVDRAARFALDMVDFVHTTRWEKVGLPETLDIRVGLHAGPVYHCKDPVLNAYTYTGTHVSRAARIEPITRQGQVFASSAFAALAAVEGRGSFVCEYVGRTPFAKDYGTYPVFHLRRG